MGYTIKMEGEGLSYEGEVSREKVASVLDFLIRGAAEQTETPPTGKRGEKQKKWHKANKKGAKVQGEIAGHYAKKQHPETERIEKMLIEGATVPAIIEKIDVSPPTVYVIKNRLKKEGKIPV